MYVTRFIACSAACAVLCSSTFALADDESEAEQREDPFAYERTKAAERKARGRELGPSDLAFGWASDTVISAERVFGYARTGRRIDLAQPASDLKETVDRVHLLLNGGNDVRSFSAPRIAFDHFLTDGLSLGALVGYSSAGGDEHALAFLASVRLGYAFMFGKVVGLWPRLGPTYQYFKVNGTKGYVLAGSFELPLVFVTSNHSIITFGPTLDATFYGQINPAGRAIKWRPYNQDELGVSAGVSLFF